MKIMTSRKLRLAFLFLFFSATLFSQASKGVKLINKGQFDEAYRAIQLDINSDKYLAFAQYGMGKLYSTIGYNNYQLDSAYHYILLSEKSFRRMNYKLKNKLKKELNTTLIKSQKKTIVKAAYTASEETNTLE